MTCLSAITFGVVCALNAPSIAEPQPFHFGKATNRSDYGLHRFVSLPPDVGPVISFRPEEKSTRSFRTAYASPLHHAPMFKSFKGKSFIRAHGRVETSCFPKRLAGILHDAERKFGRQVIVTSGYRSPSYNRRVKGAKHSQHMRCKAADIRIPGVSKTTLYAYLLRHPKRGGVGIYNGRWVHVDTGRRRTWDWRRKRK